MDIFSDCATGVHGVSGMAPIHGHRPASLSVNPAPTLGVLPSDFRSGAGFEDMSTCCSC